MKRRQKIILILVSVIVVAGLVALILYLRGLAKPTPAPAGTPTPTPSPRLRTLGNERFGPHARPAGASNVDIGVITVRVPDIATSPAPASASAPKGNVALVALASPFPYLAPTAAPRASATPTAAPRPPAPTPTPIQPPPTFAPLPPGPAPQIKELGIVYAKGADQKRQVYVRSIDRDKDDQLVSDVFDDYGVALSSAQQKVAFYSNEEGPSDAAKSRTKLKVVDLATRKVQTLLSNLPGTWPVAWSPNGQKIAIPTTGSIFIADVGSGTSLQIPTGKDPGAITWAPGGLKFFFQAETTPGNHDIFQADSITAQATPVVSSPDDETLPSVSVDGQQIMFLKQAGSGQVSGAAVVIRSLASGQEKTYPETAPATSYLFNLDLTDLVFVQGDKEPHLSRFKSGKVQSIGDLAGPVLVSWDRDYQHVFVLADDDQGKALFSVDIATGAAEKIKAGVSGAAPAPVR